MAFKDIFFVISCIFILFIGTRDIWANAEIMNAVFNVLGMAGGISVMYWLIYDKKTLS